MIKEMMAEFMQGHQLASSIWAQREQLKLQKEQLNQAKKEFDLRTKKWLWEQGPGLFAGQAINEVGRRFGVDMGVPDQTVRTAIPYSEYIKRPGAQRATELGYGPAPRTVETGQVKATVSTPPTLSDAGQKTLSFWQRKQTKEKLSNEALINAIDAELTEIDKMLAKHPNSKTLQQRRQANQEALETLTYKPSEIEQPIKQQVIDVTEKKPAVFGASAEKESVLTRFTPNTVQALQMQYPHISAEFITETARDTYDYNVFLDNLKDAEKTWIDTYNAALSSSQKEEDPIKYGQTIARNLLQQARKVLPYGDQFTAKWGDEDFKTFMRELTHAKAAVIEGIKSGPQSPLWKQQVLAIVDSVSDIETAVKLRTALNEIMQQYSATPEGKAGVKQPAEQILHELATKYGIYYNSVAAFRADYQNAVNLLKVLNKD